MATGGTYFSELAVVIVVVQSVPRDADHGSRLRSGGTSRPGGSSRADKAGNSASPSCLAMELGGGRGTSLRQESVDRHSVSAVTFANHILQLARRWA